MATALNQQRLKRYRGKDNLGHLRNKRHISVRPVSVEARIELGHSEIVTVMGCGSKHCILTLVERATGYTLIGKLNDRTNRRVIELIQRSGKEFKKIARGSKAQTKTRMADQTSLAERALCHG